MAGKNLVDKDGRPIDASMFKQTLSSLKKLSKSYDSSKASEFSQMTGRARNMTLLLFQELSERIDTPAASETYKKYKAEIKSFEDGAPLNIPEMMSALEHMLTESSEMA